jgi:type VI secretion system protein ImpB
MKVENTLEGDDSVFEADISFSSMKDFEPESLIGKIEPLTKLMETRTQLKDLLAKADRSRDLEALLKEVLSDGDTITALSKELGLADSKKKIG